MKERKKKDEERYRRKLKTRTRRTRNKKTCSRRQEWEFCTLTVQLYFNLQHFHLNIL